MHKMMSPVVSSYSNFVTTSNASAKDRKKKEKSIEVSLEMSQTEDFYDFLLTDKSTLDCMEKSFGVQKCKEILRQFRKSNNPNEIIKQMEG